MEKRSGAGRHSLTAKITVNTVIAVVAAMLFNIVIVSNIVKKNLVGVCENYLSDISQTNRDSLDSILHSKGEEKVSAEEIAKMVGNVKLKGMDTSYAYVVDKTGMVLYHPNAEKIKKQVENEVVRSVVAEIEAGKEPQDDIVSYTYDGIAKYAAYALTDEHWIVVLTVDCEEVLAPLYDIYKGCSILLVVIVLVMGPIVYILSKHQIRPVVELANILDRSAKLDFRPDPYVEKASKRKDECGMIGKSVQNLQKEMQRFVGVLQGESVRSNQASESVEFAAERAAAAMAQVESSMTEIAQGAASQAQDTVNAGSDVQNMGEMIELVNRAVIELDGSTVGMQQASDQAADILRELEELTNQINGYMNQVEQQTEQTNISAQKIRTATDFITSIAEETNLLSLNASIEAARAGEHGKGFGVVAIQIQKLAEQSNDSAEEINHIIDTLMEDSQRMVENMRDVRGMIQKQSEKVGETDQMFLKVKEGVDMARANITDIAKKAEDIDVRRGQITDVIESLTAIAEENAASTHETSSTTQEVNAVIEELVVESENLKELSQQLESQMERFQIQAEDTVKM